MLWHTQGSQDQEAQLSSDEQVDEVYEDELDADWMEDSPFDDEDELDSPWDDELDYLIDPALTDLNDDL